MDIPWPDAAAITVSLAGTAVAVGALRTARRAQRTADGVAQIEDNRWHADLTPQFTVTIQDAEGDRATLDVQLTGPIPLRHLDEVRIKVIDSDDMERISRLPGGPPPEDVARQVWGPYRFVPGADGADEAGRAVAAVPLQVGRGRPFALERTRPPYWQEGPNVGDAWRSQWSGKPVRLELECRRTGLDPWVVPCRVEQPVEPWGHRR